MIDKKNNTFTRSKREKLKSFINYLTRTIFIKKNIWNIIKIKS